MAEEDFEIDIYGDANAEGDNRHDDSNSNTYENSSGITVAHGSNNSMSHSNNHNDYGEDGDHREDGDQSAAPVQSFQQGVKRKEAPDDRPTDPGATNCLLLSDLQWWNSDDDIRGWARTASCEEELKDITFSEHKVNGKSKGQAYIEFTSQQAASATKHAIEGGQSAGKKATVVYTNPNNNPFRTLPKDGPARQNKDATSRGGSNSSYNDRGGMSGGYSGNFRGRGGYNRGGFNRNFSGGNMGGGGGGFNNNNNMGGGGGGGGFNMGGNFGFNNRGNPMMGGGGMRGGPGGMRGRGGMNNMNNMNNGMMGGMMGGMGGMGMPMGGMPGGMGMGGFPQQPHFNPTFFGGNQQWDGNPHGAKRPRGE